MSEPRDALVERMRRAKSPEALGQMIVELEVLARAEAARADLLTELRAAVEGLPVGRVASWFERGVVAERATDVLDRAAVLDLLEPPR